MRSVMHHRIMHAFAARARKGGVIAIACAALFTSACDVHGVSQPGTLATLIVSPNPRTLAVNGTQQFSATGADFSGAAMDVSPTWTVVAGGGTITESGMFTAGTTVGTFTSTVRATSRGMSSTATVIVTVGPLATITVTPSPVVLGVGAAQQFTATGRDAAGNVVAIAPVWSLENGGGTINAGNGLFSAGSVLGTYSNTVRATIGGVSGVATVSVVAGPLASITISPNPDTTLVNGTRQFTAVGRDANGNTVAMTPVWSINNGGGAIDATSGLFTAGSVPGTFSNTVRATSGSISGVATETVLAGALASIVVTPNPVSLGIGAAQLFTAVGRDASGNIVPFTPVWTVVNGGGAISASSGVFLAGSLPGTFANTIRATSGTLSGTATVTVTAGALASITVTPNPASLGIGGSQQFVATGQDASGNILAITPVWSVTNGGGTIGAGTGLFTAGSAVGTFANTVRATVGGLSGSATVIVSAGALAAIEVTPNPAVLGVGAAQLFTAVGRDAAGNVVAITPVWSVVNGGGAISAASGVFLAANTPGTYANTVRATFGALSGFATVSVVVGPLASITVSPNPDVTVIGGTRQFTAVGRDVNGNIVALTPGWSVTNGGGTIDAISGVFTAGTTTGTFVNTVRATSGSISGSATETVVAGALTSITVTPSAVSLGAGAAQLFTAVGRDASGNLVPITPVWTVVNGGGAISASSGVFLAGNVPGTYANTVQATFGTVSGSASVTVVVGPLASITVTPNSDTTAVNGSSQFTAVGRDANGNTVALTPVWTVENGGGTINAATGMFTAGTTTGTFVNTVRATSGTISGAATETVVAGALASITVTPNPVSLAVGAAQLFGAVGRDASGNIVPITPVWTVVNGGGAISASSGVFLAGNVPGTYTNTVMATSGSVTGTATVSVVAGPLASITITPNPDTTAANGTSQFTAVGRDAVGNRVVVSVTWAIVNGGGAIDNATGLFSAGVVPGTFVNTVRATSGTISGYATETVLAPPPAPPALVTITVTPNPASVLQNASQQFTAVGRDGDGLIVPIVPVWTVVNGGGTINAATGLFTAGAIAGTFNNTVRATSGTVFSTATVTVTAVIPPPFLIDLGVAGLNGIMAGTAVTCVTGGIVHANVAISPGNTLTGFGPCVIDGVQHLGDGVASQGQIDLTTAYNTLAGLPCPPANAIIGNLGGTIKAAGVYCSAIGIAVTGTLTLDGGGDPNAMFVFQAGTSLITAGDIVLINGAQAKNVYWQVGSSATIGTASQWQGNILALTSITIVDNANLRGRALARNGGVTLGTNNIITLP